MGLCWDGVSRRIQHPPIDFNNEEHSAVLASYPQDPKSTFYFWSDCYFKAHPWQKITLLMKTSLSVSNRQGVFRHSPGIHMAFDLGFHSWELALVHCWASGEGMSSEW